MKDTVDTLYYSNDTIFCIINLLPINAQVDNKSYFYLTLNELLTLLIAIASVIVAIIQFRRQMAIKQRRTKKYE